MKQSQQFLELNFISSNSFGLTYLRMQMTGCLDIACKLFVYTLHQTPFSSRISILANLLSSNTRRLNFFYNYLHLQMNIEQLNPYCVDGSTATYLFIPKLDRALQIIVRCIVQWCHWHHSLALIVHHWES